MVGFPSFFRWIYPSAIWNIPSKSKVVYLTFDDGPTPSVTNEVLQILDNYEAKATFFCIGKNIKENPELFAQLQQKGHHVGSHTYSHLNGWKTDQSAYLIDYQNGKDQVKTNLFRPPYGRLLLKTLINIQKHDKVIMWDILSKDYNPSLSPEQIIANVKKHLRPGSIIVFHDSIKAKNNLLPALPEILKHLKANGFTTSAIPY